jgi:hypothetical protein
MFVKKKISRNKKIQTDLFSKMVKSPFLTLALNFKTIEVDIGKAKQVFLKFETWYFVPKLVSRRIYVNFVEVKTTSQLANGGS